MLSWKRPLKSSALRRHILPLLLLTALKKADVMSALSGVQNPEIRSPVTEFDMVGEITFDRSAADFSQLVPSLYE